MRAELTGKVMKRTTIGRFCVVVEKTTAFPTEPETGVRTIKLGTLDNLTFYEAQDVCSALEGTGAKAWVGYRFILPRGSVVLPIEQLQQAIADFTLDRNA